MEGEILGEMSLEKARSTGFSSKRTQDFIVAFLSYVGCPVSGEDITDAAKKAGNIPHDDRAFGPVYASLLRHGRIVISGTTTRRKGHGTAGGRVYSIKA